jgi:hypothetical protein
MTSRKPLQFSQSKALCTISLNHTHTLSTATLIRHVNTSFVSHDKKLDYLLIAHNKGKNSVVNGGNLVMLSSCLWWRLWGMMSGTQSIHGTIAAVWWLRQANPLKQWSQWFTSAIAWIWHYNRTRVFLLHPPILVTVDKCIAKGPQKI